MSFRTWVYFVGPSNFLLSVLAGLCLLANRASAQERGPRDTLAKTAVCSPIRSTRYDGIAPSLPEAASDAATATRLALAYRQIARSTDESAARTTFEELRNNATDGQSCTIALALFGLGEANRLEKPDVATEYFHQAGEAFRNIKSPQGMAWVEFRFGLIDRAQKRFMDALLHFDKAKRIFEDAGDVESGLIVELSAQGAAREPSYGPLITKAHDLRLPCVQATMENAWANSLWKSDHFAEAMDHYQASDKLYALCPDEKSARASLQTALGRMERQQGRPLAALEHYKVALALQMESGDTALVPQTYNAMGVAYEALKDYPHAIARYKQGLAFARQIRSQPYTEFLEGNLAAAYSRNQQPQLALPLLQTLSENVTDDHLRCLRLDQLGTTYSHLFQDERAVAMLRRGKEACHIGNENERIVENDATLTTSELRLREYAEALRDAQEGLSILEDARAHLVATDAYKQGFGSTNLAHDLYNNAIAALTALHRGKEAFEVAEQARARAFLDLLASHQNVAKTPPDAGQVALYRKDLIDSPAHSASLATTAMAAELSHLNSTLLAYWVSDDCIYIWTARDGQPMVEVRQPISADLLNKLVTQTRSAGSVHVAASPAWRELYHLLVAPVESQLPQVQGALVTIVPSGPLFALSFAALRGPNGRYLIERYRLHTTPSISLLSYTRRNAEINAGQASHYLLIANPEHLPVGNDARALPSLPGADLEANAIARSLPAKRSDASVGP